MKIIQTRTKPGVIKRALPMSTIKENTYVRAPYPQGVRLNLNFFGVNLGLGVFYVDAYTSFSFCY